MRYIFILKDFMGQCVTCLIHQSYHCGDKVIKVHGYDLVEQNIVPLNIIACFLTGK